MRTDLNDQQISFYQDQGYIIIDDFLDSTELADWRHCVDLAVQQRGAYRLTAREDFKDDPTYYNRVFTQRINLWMDHPGMHRLMCDATLGRMAATLEQVQGIRIWHDQVLIKEAWGNPTSWHQDNPKWSFTSDHAISIWVALDDVTLENGCLFFLPGTHKKRLDKDVPAGGNSIGQLFETFPELAHMHPIAAPMKAGSCSFHNGLTVHSAHANMSPGKRRAMTCAYMPDGSIFNGQANVLPPAYLKSLAIGDRLDNNEQNPLLYCQS